MTLFSSLRSRSTVQDPTRAAEPAKRFATLTRRGVIIKGIARTPVQLATRSSASVSHSDLIFASVFGSIGFVLLVALVFMLVRCWMRREDTSEDMIIERPSQTFQETRDTPIYQQRATFQNTPVSITPPTFDPPDRAYIPNHPYALSYTRDSSNSFPPAPPAKNTTHPQTQHPSLPSVAISHPYTYSQSRRQERVPSADPSTIYESFMSNDSPIPSPPPIIEPMEPSPLASTVGGAINHHDRSQFDGLLSAALSDDAPSSMSASSSAPLRPGEKHPRQ